MFTVTYMYIFALFTLLDNKIIMLTGGKNKKVWIVFCWSVGMKKYNV